MVTNHYETLLVLETAKTEDEKQAIVDRTKAIIEKEGKIEKLDVWGNRRLAYPINYQTEGYYVVIQFISNSDLPRELDRVYRITDGILRSIIIKRDERYLTEEAKPKKEHKSEEPAEEAAPVQDKSKPVRPKKISEIEEIKEESPIVEETIIEEIVVPETPEESVGDDALIVPAAPELIAEEVVEIVAEEAPAPKKPAAKKAAPKAKAEEKAPAAKKETAAKKAPAKKAEAAEEKPKRVRKPKEETKDAE